MSRTVSIPEVSCGVFFPFIEAPCLRHVPGSLDKGVGGIVDVRWGAKTLQQVREVRSGRGIYSVYYMYYIVYHIF